MSFASLSSLVKTHAASASSLDHSTASGVFLKEKYDYPLVIKNGSGKYIMICGDVPIETPISSGFPSLPRLIAGG